MRGGARQRRDSVLSLAARLSRAARLARGRRRLLPHRVLPPAKTGAPSTSLRQPRARAPRCRPSPPRQVVTAGADATVRVWDAKSCDCTFVFRPPQATPASEAPVVGVALNPQNVDQVLVATRSPTLYLMTLQGQVRRGRHPGQA